LTSTAPSTALGQTLVDGNGKTLYLFEANTSSQSTCTGDCAQMWPPFTTSAPPTATGAAVASLLSTTVRDDGTTQVTYHGHPLYHYVSDANPGEINGEGLNCFGGVWDVVSPAGDKIESVADEARSSPCGKRLAGPTSAAHHIGRTTDARWIGGYSRKSVSRRLRE